VLLGAGLFAAAFFSDKSGHDQEVTDATGAKSMMTRSRATEAQAAIDGYFPLRPNQVMRPTISPDADWMK
jgi:hypothetical protein